MLLHYIRTAIRNLSRQKILAFINISGLSIGMACFCLFLLYTVYEFSYDRFHSNGERIYIVSEQPDNRPQGDTYLYMPLGPALQRDFGDVEQYVRISGGGVTVVKAGSNMLRLPVNYADPQLFSVFSFPLLSGNPANALQGARNVVLTREKARQLFGREDVLGETLEINTGESMESFIISGVAENVPGNSSIRFGVLLSFNYLLNTPRGRENAGNWHSTACNTYVLLRPGSRLPRDHERLLQFCFRYHPEEKEGAAKGEPIWRFRLHPLRGMHTNASLEGAADPGKLLMLLCIAGGVLLIACINFTTLAIGRSAGRAREVCVRKVMGSARWQLMYQFMAESLLLSVLSALAGLLLARLLLPYFNQLAGVELQFSLIQHPQMIWLLTGVTLLAGLLAGSYPALVLSGFDPIGVLRRNIRLGGANMFTRSLVTLQFVFSACLIIATTVIIQQLQYMRGRNPGFNRENVVVLDASRTAAGKVYASMRRQLEGRPGIGGMACSDRGLGAGKGFEMYGIDIDGKKQRVFQYYADADYLRVMGIPVIAGRNFSRSFATDTVNAVIVNEALVKALGLTPQTAVGKTLAGYTGEVLPVVIGVVKDFNFNSLHTTVAPQLFQQFSGTAPERFFIRLRPGNPAPALQAIEKAWKSAVPGLPLQYSFLDQDLDRFYKGEVRLARIMGWAGGISVFLACLGLFGLAALAAVNRTREVGIRKVMGASVAGIVTLLSKDFLKLVGIALLIAIPLAIYVMQQWLHNFAYRVQLRWQVLAAAALASLLIALITVGAQALKAALASPVKSLRDE